VVTAALLFVASSCADGGSETAPVPTTVLSRPTTPTATAADATGDPENPVTLPGEVPETAPPETAAPAPTGVAGVDSDVPFCRAYTRLVGSTRVLLISQSFGDVDPDQAALVEVLAGPAIAANAAAVIESWPAELAEEREVVATRVVGPVLRRAERAVQELVAAGVDEDGLLLLETWWLDLLLGWDNESLQLDLPELVPPLDAQVAAAAARFATVFVPIVEDPALARAGVTTPATDAYVDRECPEARSVVVGDEI
jgi:hypothetical protein